jgi:hypothetical protein
MVSVVVDLAGTAMLMAAWAESSAQVMALLVGTVIDGQVCVLMASALRDVVREWVQRLVSEYRQDGVRRLDIRSHSLQRPNVKAPEVVVVVVWELAQVVASPANQG